MRQKLFLGNWKMHFTLREAKVYFEKFISFLFKKPLHDRIIGVAPPFTALYYVKSLIKDTNIKLCAQNVHFAEKGAFTGEISPLMLKELGVEYVILGHSERRHIFGENDALISKRVEGAYQFGLIPVLCVGETLIEREENKTFEQVETQVREGLKSIKEFDPEKLVIAYEPVWAIGTGKNATPEQAEEVHAFIRKVLAETYGEDMAKKICILYGGSVTPENIKDLIKMPNVDGVLVGGASLDPEKFYKICSVDL
ncbi:MAG: triose-phosphate isomerase [Caldimicrobium sp.]